MAKPKVIEPIVAPSRSAGFDVLLLNLLRGNADSKLSEEPIALPKIDYARELKAKNEALRLWWAEQGLPDKPNLITLNPEPRAYRLWSRIRPAPSQGSGRLRTPGAWPDLSGDALATEVHRKIATHLIKALASYAYSGLSRHLVEAGIRGDALGPCLTLRADRIDATIARKAKLLAERLAADVNEHLSVLLLVPSKGASSMAASDPARGGWLVKRLQGTGQVHLGAGGLSLWLSSDLALPANASGLGLVQEKCRQLLKARSGQKLVEIGSGAGLITVGVAVGFDEVLALEPDPGALQAARGALAQAGPSLPRVNLRRCALRGDDLRQRLSPPVGEGETILLHSRGMISGPGVIATLAERQPSRAVHVIHGLAHVKREIDLWRKNGYMLAKAIPVDLEPGIADLGVLALMIPDTHGLLGRRAEKPGEKLEKGLEETVENKPRKKPSTKPSSKAGARTNRKSGTRR